MKDISETKLVVILALVAAIAVAGTVAMLGDSVIAASHKNFGQCNKAQNAANHAANITGKAAADKRKAACASLKPTRQNIK